MGHASRVLRRRRVRGAVASREVSAWRGVEGSDVEAVRAPCAPAGGGEVVSGDDGRDVKVHGYYSLEIRDPAEYARRFGNRVSIGDLSEAEARTVFGDAVYEAWLEAKKGPRPQGTCTVVGIDREARTVTLVKK